MATATTTTQKMTSPLSPQQFVDLIAGPNGMDRGMALLAKHNAVLAPTCWPQTCIVKFDETTQSTDPEVIRLRGLIFNHKTSKILSLGHPVPYEFKELSPERQQQVINKLHQTTYRVEEALDGTLLRLWNHPEDGWMLSTNSKENAEEAFWMNGISFAQQFREAYPKIQYPRLNPDYVYIFRVCHPCNVIVVNYSVPQIYHVATYNRITYDEVPIISTDDVSGSDLGLDLPMEWSGRVSIAQIINSVIQSQTLPVRSAGWMVIVTPDRDGVVERYRFENQNYTLARALRGNSNDVMYTLVSNFHHGQLIPFLQCYPIYQKDWECYWSLLIELAHQIYQEYLQVFIKKSKTPEPQFRGFINDLQRLYLEQTQIPRPRMTIDRVWQILLVQEPARLCHLLKNVE